MRHGRNTDPLAANLATGIPSRELVNTSWGVTTAYRLRLFARLGAGAQEAIAVASNYYIDDGLGDGERLVSLATSLATGLEVSAYSILEGVALSLRVRVETVPAQATAAARQCLTSASVAEAAA